MGRPTMNDVARNAGVSLKTVSRVVNGETTVDPGLAARVRAAVAALGYRPNLGASMLRRNDRRTRMIGVLLTDLAGPFSAAVHRAVEDEARARGVHVLGGSTDDDPQRAQDLVEAFARRHVDGVILTAPAVVDLPSVVIDREAGIGQGMRHLRNHGHRRIVFVEREVHAVFALPDPPTAILAGSTSVTIEVVRALRERGLRDRVALVGLGDFPTADLLEPAVTVVAQDPAATGRAAAGALFEQIDGGTQGARAISIPTTLIARGSGEIRPATGS
ncbi:LacI family transcriptional regulator [Winogradskya humida]|uniref:LacI family transcriptional regulator n=2 Tax=Winogradskya humida TaxID=113566 RepID=A0ABQ3ZLH7_9ACTN|nr:LacI family transcriptional regulator [Actinoplanes humidus]